MWDSKYVKSIIKTVCEQHTLPGISVCIRNNDSEWNASYGVRSMESKDSLQVNDLFRAGSTTKTLIATIIMQLKEEGSLSLNQSIMDILQGDLDINPVITIRQLLNHRSGIEDYLWIEEEGQPMLSKFDGPNEQFSPWFLVKKGFQKNPQFDPNEGYYYSNTNYIILGLIIEKVTGKSLKKVMNQRLFEPLGMEQSYFPKNFSMIEPHANGHSKLTKDFQLSEEIECEYDNLNVSLAWASGALVSTPSDLTKFMCGVFNHHIISFESLKEMMTFWDTGDDGQSYGLGLYKFKNEQKIGVGHPGGISGYETIMLHYPSEDLYLTVMINQMPAGAIMIADEIYSRLQCSKLTQ